MEPPRTDSALATSGAIVTTLSVRADATLERLDDGVLALVEGHVRMPLRRLGVGLAGAVMALSGGVTEDELFELVSSAGDQGVMNLQLLLRRLETGGWIARTVSWNGQAQATLEPHGHVVPPSSRVIGPTTACALSRFAHLRRDGDRLVVESPLAAWRVMLHDVRLAALAGALCEPATAPDVAAATGLDPRLASALLQMLMDARCVDVAADPGDPALAQWSFADLLFHARSRVGRNLGGYGGTYHRDGVAEPLPAVREPFPVAVDLPVPDLAAARENDLPFAEVVERRQSIRVHDDENPITRGQLGELLFRVARLRGEVVFDGHEQLSSRPYPSGGALYELELYPLVHRCDGVDSGLYHYDPQAHCLGAVAAPGPATALLLEYARRTGVMVEPPQITLLVVARFGRVMWKYESMAYALVLKHVGVLYEALYLTTTAMGVAGCALGGGNADAFAAASGLDYYAETTVGEFLVGSRMRTSDRDAGAERGYPWSSTG